MPGLQPPDVCVLIPAYNEEQRVARTVRAAKELGFPVLVVDDGSRDGTAQTIQTLGVHFILSRENEGKGASLRKGFDWFLKQNYSALVLMDADGQHDPGELLLFVEAISDNTVDFVIGNRMENPHGMPWLRRATNRCMSWIISRMAGQEIPDTQCGYRAIRRAALQKIKLRTTNFEIESEMLLEATRLKLKIRSIPIRSVYEGEGSHIHPLCDTWRFVKFIFEFSFRRR